MDVKVVGEKFQPQTCPLPSFIQRNHWPHSDEVKALQSRGLRSPTGLRSNAWVYVLLTISIVWILPKLPGYLIGTDPKASLVSSAPQLFAELTVNLKQANSNEAVGTVSWFQCDTEVPEGVDCGTIV